VNPGQEWPQQNGDAAMPRNRLAAAVRSTLATWHERAVGRHVLTLLDARTLRDIGLDRGSALHEARKWFWQP